jgi:hypothetical protein
VWRTGHNVSLVLSAGFETQRGPQNCDLLSGVGWVSTCRGGFKCVLCTGIGVEVEVVGVFVSPFSCCSLVFVSARGC